MADSVKAGHAIDGLFITMSTLNMVNGAGQIDGRTIESGTAGAVTGATTSTKFQASLLSEDGDGTFTVTKGTDDLASAALAAADALLIPVPAGGVAIATVVVKEDGTVSNLDHSRRGESAAVTADDTVSL